MFKKNKKNQSFLEEEVIVATSKSEKKNEKINRRRVKAIKDIEIVDNSHIKSKNYELGSFTFYDSDPQNECSVDDLDIEEVTNVKKSADNRKDLSSFFEESKRYNSMMQEKESNEKKEYKNKSNTNLNFSDTNNEYEYVFRNIKYTNVEDFIKFLDSHYLDIDNISEEVLSDELFYEWLSKKSNVFDDSLKQFKDIKEKIEKK